MKSNYKIATAVIASFVLGAGAVSVLHAQAKLPAYVVAEIDVKDQDGYTKDFLPKAQANINGNLLLKSGGQAAGWGARETLELEVGRTAMVTEDQQGEFIRSLCTNARGSPMRALAHQE